MSDINMIKKASKLMFDLFNIEDCIIMGGLFLTHPFTNSPMICLSIDDKNTFVNLLENKTNQILFRENIFKRIDEANDIYYIMMLVNKPYRLLWFKLINNYLDNKDFGNLLAEIWVDSENPNDDVNVSLKECISFFRQAKLKSLMNKDELKVFLELPETITVYRGVSKNRNSYGLSYTLDKDKAIWFQNRFADKNNKGFLIQKTINKNLVLAYFSRRDEDEIVVDTTDFYFE